ncbi:MAG: HNH endonuclease [Syntrophomonas sp.]
MIINKRGLRCEHCGQLVARASELTLHHKEELTPENIHDVMITLNPDNVMVVHHDCHNKIHNRFGYRPAKEVCIIFGPPLAGKKTFVQQYMSRGDLIVDMDRLYAAVSLLPVFDKPDNLLANIRGIHNQLVDNIRTRYGKWNNAWVIGGYADRYKREKLADDLGAELIFCDVSRDECLRRLAVNEALRARQDEWAGYINKWFDEYVA